MGSIAPTADAFRFVDILSPRRKPGRPRGYVISRDQLAFPETSFESALRGLDPNQNYRAQLLSAIEGLGNRPTSAEVSQGYLADLDAYGALIFQGAGEDRLLAELSELRTKLQGARQDDIYLTTAAARAWDLYLAGVIAGLMDRDWEAALQAKLSMAVRVAAALFRGERIRAGADEDLSNVGLATIGVEEDLVSRRAIRNETRARGPDIVDPRARTRQDKLLQTVLRVELARDELARAISRRSVSFTAPPAPPPAPPVPPAGQEQEYIAQAAPPLIEISKADLSSSTADLLTSAFDASDTGTHIKIDLMTTLRAMDRVLSVEGAALFGSASAGMIASTREALELLKHELETSTVAAVGAQISKLPLITSPSGFTGSRSAAVGNEAVRPLGVAHLKTVKQSLLRYEAGEVAHIENVMKGEQRERLHSVKQTTEETITVEIERSASTERDLQSTDRFEMSEEAAITATERQQNEAGVTVTATYGPVSISANTKYSDESSNEMASKVSRKFVREVVDRSVEKVQQRVREERVRKTTLSIEETNRHVQHGQADHVRGIYRWVDKIYWAQVNVYDKRLMLEFTVPEPAVVFLHGKSTKPVDPSAVTPPEPFNIKPSDVQRYTYQSLASRWGAEVDNPPPSARLVKYGSRTNADTDKGKISLGDDWIGVSAAPAASWVGYPRAKLHVHIGTEIWTTGAGAWSFQYLSSESSGEIPLLVTPFEVTSYNVAAAVITIPSDEAMERWQLETYKSLLSAYNLRKMEYEEYLASRLRGQNMPTIGADKTNREVERLELQRGCIEILTKQHFQGRGAIDTSTSSGWPEIDFAEAEKQGQEVLFFQHSFEWGQMTYVFYPYFWSDQARWSAKLNGSGGDALFNRFLSAGFARVVVPVRPAHEPDVLHFLETGVIHGGKDPPTIGDETYLDIIEELKETLDAPDHGTPDGTPPWQFKIPTSLVILDDDVKLPEWPNNVPSAGPFQASTALCGGVPYNAAQWKDSKTIADAIRRLGYAIDNVGDQAVALKNARSTIRAMQVRFNELGVTNYIGGTLKTDGRIGPCTLRALTYFEAMRVANKWPGVG